VRDLGGALLEGGVDQPGVHVREGAGVEAACDQVVDGQLHRPHVHPPGEAEVRVEQVAVAVLFRGPAAHPAGPRLGAVAGAVAGEQVEHDCVVRQRLLRDHVADEHDEHLVGELLRRLAERGEALPPVRGREVREVVRRLPRLVGRRKEREVFLDL
jgi:hypothetical protein